MSSITVQIICITYNHAAFIGQALESFVMQKTDFSFEVIVAEDCSPDNTREIIEKYREKYPHIVKPLYQERNVGANRNFLDAANRLNAKYIAICEGDDYWTDPYKLQKQVDALESQPACTVCFHPVMVKWEDGCHPDSVFPTQDDVFHKHILTFDDLKKRNFIQTNSVMYRWAFHNKSLSAVYPENVLPGDWLLHLLHAYEGDILLLDDVMSVYRKWAGGLWAGAGVSAEWFCNCGILHINFFMHLEKVFPGRYYIDYQGLSFFAKKILNAAEKLGKTEVATELYRQYPQYIAFSSTQLSQTIPYKIRTALLNLYFSLRFRISKIPLAKRLYHWLKTS